MNRLILLISILSLGISINIDLPKIPQSSNSPEDIKAYGTINFGDSKQYVQSKFKENGIYRNSDTNAYIISIFDIPFEIQFIYGTNDRRPTFLKAIRLKLYSIVDSYIINEVISAFENQYGPSKKYYIDIYGDTKEYFKWTKDDKVIHLDFDGMNIDITINSKHFNKLSKSYIEKDIEAQYRKKADRHKEQIKKLF